MHVDISTLQKEEGQYYVLYIHKHTYLRRDIHVDIPPKEVWPDSVCVTDEVGSERACDTLLMCIVTVMNHGLRNGGGVGDVLRKPSKNVAHLLLSTHLYTFYHLHIYTPIIYTSIHLLSSTHLYTFYQLHTFYHLRQCFSTGGSQPKSGSRTRFEWVTECRREKKR